MSQKHHTPTHHRGYNPAGPLSNFPRHRKYISASAARLCGSMEARTHKQKKTEPHGPAASLCGSALLCTPAPHTHRLQPCTTHNCVRLREWHWASIPGHYTRGIYNIHLAVYPYKRIVIGELSHSCPLHCCHTLGPLHCCQYAIIHRGRGHVDARAVPPGYFGALHLKGIAVQYERLSKVQRMHL